MYKYSKFVRERQRESFRIVSMLVNCEMVILAFACNLLYYVFQTNSESKVPYYKDALFWVSAILFLIVVFIVYQGYGYGKLFERYCEKWKLAKELFTDGDSCTISEFLQTICEQIDEKNTDIIPLTDFHPNKAIALDILDLLQHDGYIKYEMVDDDNYRIISRIKYKFAKAISFERFFSLI